MKKWKKMIAAGVIGCLAAGMIAGCGGEKKDTPPQAGAKPAKIIAGMDDTFAPMGYRDDKGEIVGFDIDMANAISKEIGVPIEFKTVDWASKESELNSGRIDCIWNGFSVTPEREKVLAFTKPYMDNAQAYAVLKDSPYRTAEELKGKRLDVQEASTALSALERDEKLKASFSEIKEYPDLAACFMDLESGRADAVLADTCLIDYYMTKKPGLFRELPGEVSKDTFSIGIKKDNEALVKLLNEGIDKIIASGEATKISEKWFGKDVVLR